MTTEPKVTEQVTIPFSYERMIEVINLDYFKLVSSMGISSDLLYHCYLLCYVERNVRK
jgi:hypothetical protein